MKNLAIALVAVLVALGVYTLYSGPGEEDIREGVQENAAAAEATMDQAAQDSAEAASEASDTVTEMASDAADAVSDLADDAVAATGEALDAAGAAIEDAYEGAKSSAQELTEDAAAAAENAGAATQSAAADAAQSAEEAANEITDGDLITTTEAGEAAQEALDETSLSEATAEANAGTTEEGLATLLSVDGFNMDRVMAIIDGADLNALQQSTLKAALQQAQNSPEALEEVLAQLRGALGR